MCVHNPSAAQSWVRRVQRPVALGKASCGVPVVVDQGDKWKPILPRFHYCLFRFGYSGHVGAGMGTLVEPFLGLLDLVPTPAASPFTETQKISYAAGSRWQGEKAEHRRAATPLCRGCKTCGQSTRQC